MSVDFKIYLITDRKLITHHPSLITAVEEALKAGLKAVQLREKDLPTRELLNMAYKFREITSRYNAKLIINDRLDIALCVDADGVHLGQNSIPVGAVRKLINALRITHHASRFLIGVSTHNIAEASTAEKEGADFITYGPIYPTHSKLQYGKPVGLESLAEAAKKINIPIWGIGGIKLDNVSDVINAGAHGVALISGILGEADVKSAAKSYLKAIGEIL